MPSGSTSTPFGTTLKSNALTVTPVSSTTTVNDAPARSKGRAASPPRVFQGDCDQLEGVAAVLLVEVLPPGQLFAAPSPRAPEKQQKGFTPQLAQAQCDSIQAGQRQIG